VNNAVETETGVLAEKTYLVMLNKHQDVALTY